MSGVVYKIHNKEFSGNYTDRTSQYLHKRVRNHVDSISDDKPESSPLTKHELGDAHCFDFQNTQKLAIGKEFL